LEKLCFPTHGKDSGSARQPTTSRVQVLCDELLVKDDAGDPQLAAWVDRKNDEMAVLSRSCTFPSVGLTICFCICK
jgi:hypothetical protein